MIELHYAVSEKAGKPFHVRASSIIMIEANDSGGCVITLGGQHLAVTETREVVRQRMASSEG
jgi:hypothetical protein